MRQRNQEIGAARKEQGAALVEYAFISIIFFTVVLATIDFGRALYAYHFVSHAAREGARWAAVNGFTCGNSCNGTPPMNNGPASQTDVLNYVKNIAPAGIDSSNITVTACGVSGGPECADSTPRVCAGTPNDPTCVVGIQVGYKFNFLFPLVRNNSATLSSSSEMVISH